jgi:hypothetical protein
MVESESDSEDGADNAQHVKKSSLPQQVKQTVKEVAKGTMDTVKKASNHSSKDGSGPSWKDRSVFIVNPHSVQLSEVLNLV